MPFKLNEDHLQALLDRSNCAFPANNMIFFGLRGCIPLGAVGKFAGEHQLQFTGTDYLHMRCTFVQWLPGKGLAVYPGSTVPYLANVRASVSKGGAGVNQLALGWYARSHAYAKGDHSIDPKKKDRRHRAFRNESRLPVWRTGDDDDFEGDDRFEAEDVHDNIHCAWQQNAAAPKFSSHGCQVIAGRPRVLARNWNTELGPWAEFVAHAYERNQTHFPYGLFSGREVLSVASGAAVGSQTVRFGSSGELVRVVQDALIKHGYSVGVAGADGGFGLGTVDAVRRFQLSRFDKNAIDLIVGRQTAEALGIDWPALGGAPPPVIDALAEPDGPSVPPGLPASARSTEDQDDEEAPLTKFRSLVEGGFFSSNPFDLSVKRSIRTNNPGALNISDWQRKFPGFAGVTQPDRKGNVTAIYATPEHGVGAWFHLISKRYKWDGATGFKLSDLARKYAGVADRDHPAVHTYVSGWRLGSGDRLDADSRIDFEDNKAILSLGRAMFRHEIGGDSPLLDEQIITGVKLARSGGLPAE